MNCCPCLLSDGVQISSFEINGRQIMEVLILTFIVLTLLVVGMSVGVMMGRKPIAGSCGGMSAVGMDTACDICHGDKDICDEEQEKSKTRQDDMSQALAYEVKAKG